MGDRLSAESLRELINLTVDILTVVDDHGVIQYQSPSAGRIAGYDQEELVGEYVFEYIHPDDREAALEKFQEQVEADPHDETAKFEFRFQHKDGSWIWLEARGTNRIATELDGYVMSSRDISERKEFEQRLERTNERLDQFASTISHDLQNPLSVAQGYLDLAQAECESEHLDAVENAHDRMAALIDDLLTIARAGDTMEEPEPVELAALTDACWQNVETADATLVTEAEQTIRADWGRVQQLLENLFRNAVEHGGENVTVTVGGLDDGFYVADDGAGIPDDGREHVFDAGYSTGDGGTGFGLNIVKEIAEAHEWTVRVTDGEAGGARFEITGVEIVD